MGISILRTFQVFAVNYMPVDIANHLQNMADAYYYSKI